MDRPANPKPKDTLHNLKSTDYNEICKALQQILVDLDRTTGLLAIQDEYHTGGLQSMLFELLQDDNAWPGRDPEVCLVSARLNV